MLSVLSLKGLLDTNATTPILVDLHEFYSAPPGHRAKVTVSVTLRPSNISDTVGGRRRQKHVSFHYLVSDTTDDPVSETSKWAPVCVINSQQKSPCGRDQCESLNLGNIINKNISMFELDISRD